MVWSDEFDGNGPINSNNWFHQTQLPNNGSWYNDEIQHYTNRIDNSSVSGGILKITAKKETFTDQGYTKEYTSARLNSKFAFKYGKVEVRAKLPTGYGTWPAIWMLGINNTEPGGYWSSIYGTTSWPGCGEIDIMEHWGSNQNYIQSAIHSPSSYGNTVNHGGSVINNASTDFHIYTLEWSSEKIVFKVDGIKHYTYNPEIKNDDTWPFDAAQYLLLNIAIEPSIDAAFTESDMEIDYVRVYQETLDTDATLSDLQIDGATITGFTASANSYTYALEGGLSTPQVTSATTTNNSATTSITQASGVPGDATVVVTAPDGTTTKTYTVSFELTSPASGPEVPTALSSDVISIFSDAYTDVVLNELPTSWSDTGFEAITINSDNLWKLTSCDFLGMVTNYTTGIDVSEMDKMHIDYWVPPGTTNELSVKIVNTVNGGSATQSLGTTVTGSWQSIDIDMTDFDDGTLTNREKITQILIDSNGRAPTIYIDNFYFWKRPLTTWDGSDSNDWNTPSNWDTNIVPTLANNVTISSDPENQPVIGESTGASVNDLTVDNGASLTINNGGSLIVSGTSSGDITYNVAIADTNWHLVSSPVVGEQYDDDWISANSIASGTENNRGIAPYNNSIAQPWEYFQAGGTATFTAGIGYSTLRTAVGTYGFTGDFPTTNINPAISQNSNYWNLLGNPYPSYLNIATFISNNIANLPLAFQTIYVWDGANYNPLTTGYIHPGQGFFMSSNVASGTVSITEAMQSHQTNVSFYRTSNPSIKIMLTDGTSTKDTQINYLEGKTKSLDPGFDLGMFDGVSSSLSVYTHLIEDNQGIAFETQALPNSDYESMIVPIGVKADAGKEITFSLESLNLPTELKVFLEDKETSTFTRLDEANTDYTITLSDAINETGRFYLHTSRSMLSTNDFTINTVSIFKSDISTLRIVGLPQGNTTVKLHNVLGRQIMNTTFDVSSVKDISLSKLSTGIYIVEVETEIGILSKKIIL